MNKDIMKKNWIKRNTLSLLAVIGGTILYSLGLFYFVKPIGAYAGGVNGTSQVLIQLAEKFNIPIVPLGTLSILINIPIMLFGWFRVNKRFTILSIISVFLNGMLLNLYMRFPMVVFSDDVLVNVICGGLLLGLGGGIALRYGGSLGGSDIIAAYVSYKKDKSFGLYTTIINATIVIAAVLINPQNKEGALVTIILYFYISLVINQTHTKHKKFTALIVSEQYEILAKEIRKHCGRGATLFYAEGTYIKDDKKVLMTVISSYQLSILQDIIMQYSPNSFVNILPTKEVYGSFIKNIDEIPLR